MDNQNEQEMEQEMAAALADFGGVEESGAAQAPSADAPQAGAAEGPEDGAPGRELPLSALYDLMLPITIELGRTRLAVQEVLRLGRGSVIELDRLAGEPVDVYVGDRRFAEGEVVVLGENFGVRITRVIPPSGNPETA